jgi:hypothetical protein
MNKDKSKGFARDIESLDKEVSPRLEKTKKFMGSLAVWGGSGLASSAIVSLLWPGTPLPFVLLPAAVGVGCVTFQAIKDQIRDKIISNRRPKASLQPKSPKDTKQSKQPKQPSHPKPPKQPSRQKPSRHQVKRKDSTPTKSDVKLDSHFRDDRIIPAGAPSGRRPDISQQEHEDSIDELTEFLRNKISRANSESTPEPAPPVEEVRRATEDNDKAEVKDQEFNPENVKITRVVVDEIMRKIAHDGNEHGGLLGSTDGGQTIDTFYHDTTAKITPQGYTPDIDHINKQVLPDWRSKGIKLFGFVHSHPDGATKLSGHWSSEGENSGDLAYAAALMRSLKRDFIYMPILVKRKTENQPELIFYLVRMNQNGETSVTEVTNYLAS